MATPQRTAELGASLASVIAQTGREAVVVGMSKDPNAKLTVVLVNARTGVAELVAKVATTAAADAVVHHEHDVLARLHTDLDSSVLAEIPRPLGLVDAAGRAVLLMTAKPGAPMLTSYQSGRHTSQPAAVLADFDAADAWLARFQAASASSGPPPRPLDARDLHESLAARFVGDELAERVAPALLSLAGALGTRSATVVHGDLWAGNLLLAGGAVTGVVDWEAGSLAGDPLRDVARFALSYALYLDRKTRPGRAVAGHPELKAGEWGAGIRYAVQGRGWFPELFRRFLGTNLERVGVPASAWRQLCIAGLVDVALSADHVDFGRSHLALAASLAGDTGHRRGLARS